MKQFISTYVPEAHRTQALAIYDMLPSIPQIPEMAPDEKQKERQGVTDGTGAEESKTEQELASVTFSDQ